MSDLVIGSYTAAGSIDGSAHYLLIQPGTSSTAYNKINRNVFLGVTGQPVDISTSQTLSNKVVGNTNTVTLQDALFTLQDDGDATKQAKFQLSGITTGNIRTYTLPDASSTLADIATAQTFTNKTLTAPVINNGSITGTTITTDAIVGQTLSTSGTIYGLSVASSKIGTNGVITTSLTDSAVTPAKLFTGTGSTWVWQAWTPTYTNLTVGNGVHQSFYTQIGKTIIARLGFAFGSTSSMGSSPTFTLPVTSKSTYTGGENIGGMRYVANFTGYMGYAQWSSITTAVLQSLGVSGADTTITSSIPNTWGTAGTIYGTIMYEAA